MVGFVSAAGMEFSSGILLNLEKYISNEEESKSRLTNIWLLQWAILFLEHVRKIFLLVGDLPQR